MAADYQPQLATLVKAPPEGDGWLHEVKYDGYRIGCRIQRRTVTLWSRRGNDWTRDFPEIAAAAKGLKARSALIDGEIAVLLPDGRTSFQALQKSLAGERQGELVYFVFDLFELDGVGISREPLDVRKEALRRIGPAAGPIRFSRHWAGGGGKVFREACRLGFEGLVSKRRDQAHRAGRSPGWLKSKCVLRQEFVIGGFTEPSGSREGIGAILVGLYENDRLRFAGKVGTGFTQASSRALRKSLDPWVARGGPPRARARLERVSRLLASIRGSGEAAASERVHHAVRKGGARAEDPPRLPAQQSNEHVDRGVLPRARDGAPVSVPVAWNELMARLDPARFTIESVPSRLRDDPWKEYWTLRQKLTAATVRAVAAL